MCLLNVAWKDSRTKMKGIGLPEEHDNTIALRFLSSRNYKSSNIMALTIHIWISAQVPYIMEHAPRKRMVSFDVEAWNGRHIQLDNIKL